MSKRYPTDLELAREAVELRKKRLIRWRERLMGVQVLFRAPDGALLGLPSLRAESRPQDFLEMTGRPISQRVSTEEDYLPPYCYPNSWMQLEDRDRRTGWLLDEEQRWMTAELIEAWRPNVPENPGEWIVWRLLKRGRRPRL